MDLFEKTRDLLQCEYVSDMQAASNLAAAKRVVASLSLKGYSLRELQDMAQYLYGGNCGNMNRGEVIALLKTGKHKRRLSLFGGAFPG